MCANKIKENLCDFTSLSIFIQELQGVWNFVTQHTLLESIDEVGDEQIPQVSSPSKANLGYTPFVYSFLLGFYHSCAKIPTFQEYDCPWKWKVLKQKFSLKTLSSTLHSAPSTIEFSPINQALHSRLWISQGAATVLSVCAN